MSDGSLSPNALAELLGLHPQTVRAAYARAETRQNEGEQLSHRDAALLAAHSTPGGHLRWSRADAVRVLVAFGRPIPREWAVDPAKGAA